MKKTSRRYGIYLQHFGPNVSRDLVIEGARAAERYGFDSVWVRDHVIYHPHPQDPPDRTHLEPLTVLAAVAGATERIALGTGSLIPHRHPIYLAIQLAALSFIAGDRLIIGMGAGNFDHEFEAVGLGGIDRHELMREQLDVMRELWTGHPVSHAGTHYQFSDVDVHPEPVAPIPFWICGNTKAAARRAVEYGDGWLPSRVSRATFIERLARMRKIASRTDRPVPMNGTVSITSPGRTVEEGLSHVNVTGMLEEQAHYAATGQAEMPQSGGFGEYADLGGALIAGPPDHLVEQVELFHEAGCDHFIFDLRFLSDTWLDQLAILGEEVLPRLRARARD